MPVIHIRSLPLKPGLNAGEVACELSRRFAAKLKIDLEHVSVYWDSNPTCYAVGGVVLDSQPDDAHPVLVNVLAPDFNSPQKIESMLRAIARELSALTGIEESNVFVCYQAARSREVFDAGDIVDWDNTPQRGLGRRGDRD